MTDGHQVRRAANSTTVHTVLTLLFLVA